MLVWWGAGWGDGRFGAPGVMVLLLLVLLGW